VQSLQRECLLPPNPNPTQTILQILSLLVQSTCYINAREYRNGIKNWTFKRNWKHDIFSLIQYKHNYLQNQFIGIFIHIWGLQTPNVYVLLLRCWYDAMFRYAINVQKSWTIFRCIFPRLFINKYVLIDVETKCDILQLNA
jgi:hypothetical protein